MPLIITKAIELLAKSRQYIQKAHDDAEALHDNHGDMYMDSGQYEIMQETERLLTDIDNLIKESNV
jgi:hypothetical protein